MVFLGDIELNGLSAFNLKYKSLTESFGKLIEDYSLVRFIPLNLKNHENMGEYLIFNTIGLSIMGYYSR